VRIELIGVAFDGYGRPGNQTAAASAMRRAGFVDAFADAVDSGVIAPAAQTAARGATSLINEAAILTVQAEVRRRVEESVRDGRFPVVYGGDCTTLLGSIPGLRDAAGTAGLLHVDGHEDTTPLDVSEDGEGANAEIGLLLGIIGRSLARPLLEPSPALDASAIALLGQRDDSWRRGLNVGSLADLGVWKRSAAAVAADPAGAARDAALHVAASAPAWWLHVDVDVLDPLLFPAQGLPDVPDEPGGLTLGQLNAVAATAVQMPGCAGWSIAIYDPDQDADGACAEALTELARAVAPIIADR
jgi:arginase